MASQPTPSTFALTVAGNVRAEMARRKLRQRDLMGPLGLSQTSVSDRLNGRTPFTLDDLAALAPVLDVEPDALVRGAVA